METLLQVLLIDDSEDDALLILRELRQGGFHPISERVDTESAMKAALANKEWDLILSDYNMPFFSTYEALSILKESGRDIPFILVSGAIGEENAVQLMKEGVHDYVMKDRIRRLVPVINRELQEADERNLHRTVETRYRKSDFIVNTFSDMMALINRDYIYESVNKSYDKTFKKNNRIEIVGHSVRDLWGEEVFQKVFKENLDRCWHGEEINCEEWLEIPESGKQCFEITYTPYQDGGGSITHAVVVLHNFTKRKMVERELQQSYVKLQKTLEDTVRALSAMVELRDPYTAGHQNRVAGIAQAIAVEMNLPNDSVSGIRVASLLHDIGKIRVPSDILVKPSRLTNLEFELIKEHSYTGYELLKSIEFPWPVADIVLQHHERMDGSGYPQGLKQKDILLESRIIGVADVVEAMIFHRPYREALGLEAALDEIRKNKAILYDPEVVEACIRIFLEKGYKIHEK
ncbi:MAG TPA: HD domain-containing phosphohydrolase [Anaerolineaceae bacterium]|nr:HD domain-containing phosphohydrolase [Anaerolineaceae bacterium]